MLRTLDFDNERDSLIRELGLLTSKPVLFVANVDEGMVTSNHHLEKLSHYARDTKAEFLPICASIESELIDLPISERREYLLELGLEEPGLNRLVRARFCFIKFA